MNNSTILEQLQLAHSEAIAAGRTERAQAITAAIASIEASASEAVGMVTKERRRGSGSYKIALVAPGMPDGALVYAEPVPRSLVAIALAELLRLKTLKSQLEAGELPSGQDPQRAKQEYERAKPIAWANAYAALAQEPPAAPELTEDMIEAGMQASLLGRPSDDDESYVCSIWMAMHAAKWQA